MLNKFLSYLIASGVLAIILISLHVTLPLVGICLVFWLIKEIATGAKFKEENQDFILGILCFPYFLGGKQAIKWLNKGSLCDT